MKLSTKIISLVIMLSLISVLIINSTMTLYKLNNDVSQTNEQFKDELLLQSSIIEKISKINDYTQTFPISIDSDDNFENVASTEGWSGNGSLTNPYIIEYYNFTPHAVASLPLLEIVNTTVYFEVRNCIFTEGKHGISLDNVINGLIYNSSITYAETYGLMIINSHFLVIDNCSINYNQNTGLYLSGSSNITVSNCNFISNLFHGSYTQTSDNITLNNVNASLSDLNIFFAGGTNLILINVTSSETNQNWNAGFQLTMVGTVKIIDCKAINNPGIGMFLIGSDFPAGNFTIQNCIITDNGQKGLNIGGSYMTPTLCSISNVIIKNNLETGLFVDPEMPVDTLNIINCDISNNGEYGIEVAINNLELINTITNNNTLSGTIIFQGMTYIQYTIKNCESSFNSVNGLEISSLKKVNVSDCQFISNGNRGISLEYVSDHNIINNTIEANTKYGLYSSYCSSGFIFDNSFINNYNSSFTQAYDNFNWSTYDLNFWSDYQGVDVDPQDGIGDTPYYLDGVVSANPEDKSMDRRPVVSFQEISLTIVFDRFTIANDSLILDNNSVYIGINAFPELETMWYVLNSSNPVYFSDYSTWITVDQDGLYNITVFGDYSGTINNTPSLWLTFNVWPDISVIEAPANGTEIIGNDVSIEVDSDTTGTLFTYILNGTAILNSTTETSINLTDLEPGYYILTIIANKSGLIDTTVLTFTVKEEVIQAGISLILQNPNGGEILSGIVTIDWIINVTGSWSYLLEYSNDNGTTWKNLVELIETTETSYEWDTTNYLDNEESLLKITLTTDDINSMDISDAVFTLKNGFIELEEGENHIEFTDTINITISVSEAVNVTIQQFYEEDVPELTGFDSLDLFISIELENPLTLNYLWINVSISEFGEQDLSNVKFYFYNEDLEEWEIIETSGVDYENGIVWCYVDHITLFGALKRKSEGDGNLLGTILIVFGMLAILSALGSVIFYYAMQQKK